MTTTNQANSLMLKDQWNKGQISKELKVSKPADTLKFGPIGHFTSEAKSTYVHMRSSSTNEKKKLKDKDTKPNINFGYTTPVDRFTTISQTIDRAMH